MIAWYDYIKRQVPDVFFVQANADYPLNFAGQTFPGQSTFGFQPYAGEVLPLGNSILNGGSPRPARSATASSTPTATSARRRRPWA